jgi:hypothetical protein
MAWHPNKRCFPREIPRFSNLAFRNFRAAECIEADPTLDESKGRPSVEGQWNSEQSFDFSGAKGFLLGNHRRT